MTSLAVAVSAKNLEKTLVFKLSSQVHDKAQALLQRRQVDEADIIQNFYTHSAYDQELPLAIHHYAASNQRNATITQAMPQPCISKVLELRIAADTYNEARRNFTALALDEKKLLEDLYYYIAERKTFPPRLHIPNIETMRALDSKEVPRHYSGNTSTMLSMMLQDAYNEDDEA